MVLEGMKFAIFARVACVPQKKKKGENKKEEK